MKIDPNKKYRTRDGKGTVTKITISEDGGNYPVVAHFNYGQGGSGIERYTLSGLLLEGHQSILDLVEIAEEPPKKKHVIAFTKDREGAVYITDHMVKNETSEQYLKNFPHWKIVEVEEPTFD